jgi:hypothetical protein
MTRELTDDACFLISYLLIHYFVEVSVIFVPPLKPGAAPPNRTQVLYFLFGGKNSSTTNVNPNKVPLVPYLIEIPY